MPVEDEKREPAGHRRHQEDPRANGRPEAPEPDPQSPIDRHGAERDRQELVEIESVRIETEEPPVHVHRKEEQRCQDLGFEPPEFRAVEEVPPGPAGDQVAEMIEIIIHPPEPENGVIEQPGRGGEDDGNAEIDPAGFEAFQRAHPTRAFISRPIPPPARRPSARPLKYRALISSVPRSSKEANPRRRSSASRSGGSKNVWNGSPAAATRAASASRACRRTGSSDSGGRA